MKILKYTIPLTGCVLSIPRSSSFLSCQLQNNQIVVWYIVNVEKRPLIELTFTVIGTGHDVPEPLTYANFLQTIQMGPLVLHVFSHCA